MSDSIIALSATGNCGAAYVTGDCGAASATGDCGAASVTGIQGAASATGDYSAASATGYQGAASATGYQGAASVTGDYSAASATGRYSVALSAGVAGRASGSIGSVLFLVFRDIVSGGDDYGRIVHAKAAIVGQDGIKPDTLYTLSAEGEFVEVGICD